jgi:hypothetical protein
VCEKSRPLDKVAQPPSEQQRQHALEEIKRCMVAAQCNENPPPTPYFDFYFGENRIDTKNRISQEPIAPLSFRRAWDAVVMLLIPVINKTTLKMRYTYPDEHRRLLEKQLLTSTAYQRGIITRVPFWFEVVHFDILIRCLNDVPLWGVALLKLDLQREAEDPLRRQLFGPGAPNRDFKAEATKIIGDQFTPVYSDLFAFIGEKLTAANAAAAAAAGPVAAE